jgi:hypothetical protein
MSVSGSSHDPYEDEGFSVETVRLGTVQELLTAVPFLLGYQPRQCLVVLAADDADRLVATISTGVPTVRQAPLVADTLIHALAPAPVRAIMVIGYCPHRQAPALTALTALLPWRVDALILVDEQRWWSLARSAPQEGHPLVLQDQVQAPLLVLSGVPAASREALAATLDPGPPEVLDRVRHLLDHDPDHAAPTGLSVMKHLYRQVMAAWTAHATSPQALTEHDAAFLLMAVSNTTIRDACAVWDDDAAIALWHGLVRIAPTGWVAPAATLLALASYQRGDGTLAQLAADRALDDDPDYTLADMINRALRVGLPPHELRQALASAIRSNPLFTSHP